MTPRPKELKLLRLAQVELTAQLEAGEVSKVVTVEIVHTPTPAYSASGRPFPNPKQTDYPTLVLNVEVTVWKLDAPAAQDKSTSSTPPADGRDPSNVAATFDLPTNPAGSGIDFGDGDGSWSAAGLEEELVVDSASGEVRGSPYDRNGDADGEYTIMLTASFTHPNLGSALDIVMNLLVVDFTAPATIVLSAGSNGQLVAYANGSSLTANASNEVTVASKTEVEVVAIPDPGYRVSAWTESGTEEAGCVSNGGTGEGGRKSCTFTAGNDKDYNIAVAFDAADLSPDLSALASNGVGADNPFPADVAVLERACEAFGGTITNPGTARASCGGFNEAGATCSIVDFQAKTPESGTCYGAGVAAFKNVLACNANGMKAADISTTCGAACPTSPTKEFAVGGSCVKPRIAQINYVQPTKGADTGSGLQVFRAFGDFEGVIGSGESVPQGTWLSLRANPGTGHIVSDWGGCTGGETGTLDEKGAVKSCLAFIEFSDTSVDTSVDFAVSLRAVPTGFSFPLTPVSGEDFGPDDNINGNCTAIGGTIVNAPGFVICQNFVQGNTGVSCNIVASVGSPNCYQHFQTQRRCNLLGLLQKDILTCDFGRKCATGHVRAGNCSDGSAPVQGLPDHLDPADFRNGGEFGGLIHPIGLQDGADDFFFRAALNDSVGGRIVDGWGGAALPDVHPSLVTLNGNVADTTDSCTQLGGELVDAPPSTGKSYCVGAASPDGFCVIEPAGSNNPAEADYNFLGYFFACAGGENLFNTILRCNQDENKPAVDKGVCALEACAEGLEARGGKCIVVASDGEEAETVNVGDVSSSVTFIDSNANPPTMVEDTTANCTHLGGELVDAPPSTGSSYCVGAASPDGFCVIQPAGSNDPAEADYNFLGYFFACLGDGNLYNTIVECNRENKPAVDKGVCALESCQNGLIARGGKCVAPAPATDGLLIREPGLGGALTSGSLSVGLNENIPAGPITVRAVPTAGYHVSAWTDNCATDEPPAQASPYQPTEQECVLTKVEGEGLKVGVVFAYGLLDHSIPVTATVIGTPTEEMCAGLGGVSRVTLGASGEMTKYCDDFNAKTPGPDGLARDPQDENIEDQCWISGGFIGTVDEDDSLDGNIQRCHRAFVVARECNKLNMKSVSILPKPAISDEECDSVQGPTICAPQAFARGVDNLAEEGLCGEVCGDGMIAQGGKCITAEQAKTRFVSTYVPN